MKRPIYLDYAATTPMCLPALESLYRCLGPKAAFGNPHSQHFYGFEAEAIVDQAAERLSKLIHAEQDALIWTSGATEANNLAIQGAARFYAPKGKHLITCQSEHPSVLEVFKQLETEDFHVTFLPVQQNGLLDLKALEAALQPDTTLVSIMWVNNETGTIQSIEDIARLVKANKSIFHVDAAQALGKVAINLDKIPIDLLSLSGHKVYGPKGVGALYIRPKVRLKPLFFGGDQQGRGRAGTLSPGLIDAFASGAAFCLDDFQQKVAHITTLRNQLWQGLSSLGSLRLNTDLHCSVPHILNICFENMDGEALLLGFRKDLALSQGSACTSTQIEPSHVLKAMGLTHRQADSSFRFSFGLMTTKAEINAAIKSITGTVTTLRQRASPSAIPPANSAKKIVELSDVQMDYVIRLEMTLDESNTTIKACQYWLKGSPYLADALDWLMPRLEGRALGTLKNLDVTHMMSDLALHKTRRAVVKIIENLIAKASL